MREEEMGGVCTTYGGEHTKIGWLRPKEKRLLSKPKHTGRMILKVYVS
jgi:hypothetical protein